MSLIEHAEFEMRRAGLYDADADYGGMIPEAVMALVKAHAEQGHSGMSHGLVLEIFNRVINFKVLTPLTSNPDEWDEIDPDRWPGTERHWQNKRQSSVFSKDGGKTWYDIDGDQIPNPPPRRHDCRSDSPARSDGERG